MKIRSGFVSNSSSSSFILFLDDVPKDVEETKELLFEPGQTNYGCYDYNFTTDEIAAVVFRDLKRCRHLDRRLLVRELGNIGHWEDDNCPEMPDVPYGATPEQINEIYEDYNNVHNAYVQKLTDRLLEEHKGKLVFVVSYADEDGAMGTAMEHGGLFNKVPHVVVSHH